MSQLLQNLQQLRLMGKHIKYQVQNLSPVEEAYLLSIKEIEKQVKEHL